MASEQPRGPLGFGSEPSAGAGSEPPAPGGGRGAVGGALAAPLRGDVAEHLLADPAVQLTALGRGDDADVRFDLSTGSPGALTRFLNAVHPGVVINCAGATRGGARELTRHNTVAVATICESLRRSGCGARLVQVGNTAIDLRPLTVWGPLRPQLTMGPVQRNAGAAAVFDADRGPAARDAAVAAIVDGFLDAMKATPMSTAYARRYLTKDAATN